MLIPNPATVFARERSKNGLYQKYFFVNRPGAQWAPYGPHGPHMGPMGPIWAQWAPYGPRGPGILTIPYGGGSRGPGPARIYICPSVVPCIYMHG